MSETRTYIGETAIALSSLLRALDRARNIQMRGGFAEPRFPCRWSMTTNIDDALQFAREVDALSAMRALDLQEPNSALRPVEHMWLGKRLRIEITPEQSAALDVIAADAARPVDMSKVIGGKSSALESAMRENERLRAKMSKLAGWLDRLAIQSDKQAESSARFTTLANACKADAINYRAAAADIRAALQGDKP